MATQVTFDGVSYSVPAANEENWASLSNYLIALANAQTTNGQKVAVRVSTSATTAVATTDAVVFINYAGAATVNLPAGSNKIVLYIADSSGAAATNNITINANGANTIMGAASYVIDRNDQALGLVFSGGNWYRFSETLPAGVSGPASSVDNGVALFDGVTGKQIKDLGVGTADDVLKTNGTTPSFGKVVNANVDAAAAVAYSKLDLANSIVNADVSGSAAIAYSKLNLTGSIVNADVSASAAIAYSKLNLSNSVVDADINASAAIAYSKLALTNSIMNADVNASAAIAYSKLNLSGSIVNADINASAAIAYSKLNLANSVVNADIAAAAAIARSKIAAGTADHVVINDGSGNLSSEAALATSRGGTGLTAIGSALQILRVNAGATGLEFATISGLGDVSGPASSVTNGVVLFASTTGKAIKDGGVGTADDVLKTDGITPTFGKIVNANVDAAAAIAYSKLNLATSIVDADISGSAAIALNKLATVTASRALVSDGSGYVSASSVTSTELGYLSGVTGAIQTQIDGRVADTGDTMTGALTINTASNQLILSSGINQLTINSGTSAAARTYSVPDVGTTADFVMTAGAQTIAGVKSFSSTVNIAQSLVFQNTSSTIFTDTSDATDDKRLQVGGGGGASATRGAYINFYGNEYTSTGGYLDLIVGGVTGSLLRVFQNGVSVITSASDSATADTLYLTAGKVGIGTSVPGSYNSATNRLVVGTHSGAGGITLLSGTTSSAYVAFVDTVGTAIQGAIEYNHSTNAMNFRTNDTEQFIIASTGATSIGPSTSNVHHTSRGSMGFATTTTTGNAASVYQSGARLRFNGGTGGYAFVDDTGAITHGLIEANGSWTIGPTPTENVQHFVYGPLDIIGNDGGGGVGTLRLLRNTSTTTDYLANFRSDVGGADVTKWRVEADGDTISATGSYTSDERAKKDLKPIKYGLSQILQLNPCGFKWKHEKESDVESFSVATAQVVQAVMPELVRDDGLDDGEGGQYKAVYQNEILAVMVKAMQELKAELDDEKAKVATLEGKVK